MCKFRAQDESVTLHIRVHKSRELVHLEIHKLNLNTVIDLEYLVSFYMNIHLILKTHINLCRQMKSYGIPEWMKFKVQISKLKIQISSTECMKFKVTITKNKFLKSYKLILQAKDVN